MRVLLASDPFGGSLREALAEHLASRSPTLQVEDRGAFAKYYQAAHQVAGEVEAAAAARADPRPPPLLAVLVDSSGAVSGGCWAVLWDEARGGWVLNDSNLHSHFVSRTGQASRH